MATFASLSRRLLSRRFQNPNPNPSSLLSPSFHRFCTTPLSGCEPASEPELEPEPESELSAKRSRNPNQPPFNRVLEDGLDPGVYKAIMVGKAGQKPVQKQLRSGRAVVLFSLGTGGIRNNRRPLDNEEPREYAERCSVQWHRVSVYPERLADLALKHVKPGSILYLEGNLETKVFSDPITGLVRRIREIALRRDGRIVFLGNASDSGQSEAELSVLAISKAKLGDDLAKSICKDEGFCSTQVAVAFHRN